jgi:hypothetical protein
VGADDLGIVLFKGHNSTGYEDYLLESYGKDCVGARGDGIHRRRPDAPTHSAPANKKKGGETRTVSLARKSAVNDV